MSDVKSESGLARVLPFAITVLALADGLLHLALDAVLFRGNFFGPLGPPPGAPRPGPPPGAPPPPPVALPLPLNQMFVLNFVGYVALIVLFWVAMRRFGSGRPWVDLGLMLYALLGLLAWVDLGMPNPMGLGYLSKVVEVALLTVLIVHMWRLLLGSRAPVAARQAAAQPEQG